MVISVGSQSGKFTDKFAQNIEGLEIVSIGEGTKADGKQTASSSKSVRKVQGVAANGNPFALLQNSDVTEKGDEEQQQGGFIWDAYAHIEDIVCGRLMYYFTCGNEANSSAAVPAAEAFWPEQSFQRRRC